MLKPDGGNLQWSNETKKRSGHSIIAESDAIPSGYSVWCPERQGSPDKVNTENRIIAMRSSSSSVFLQ